MLHVCICADGSGRRMEKRTSFWDTFNKYSSDIKNQEDVNEFVSCTSYPQHIAQLLFFTRVSRMVNGNKKE